MSIRQWLLALLSVLNLFQSCWPTLAPTLAVSREDMLPLNRLLARLRGGDRFSNVSVESHSRGQPMPSNALPRISYKAALLSSVARSPTESAVAVSRVDRDSVLHVQPRSARMDEATLDMSEITSTVEESRLENLQAPSDGTVLHAKASKARPLVPSKLVARKKTVKKKEGRADTLMNGLQLRKGDALASDRYVIAAKLGDGGFGSVYGALDSKTHRHLAVKVQKPGKRSSQVALDEISFLKRCAEQRRKGADGRQVVNMSHHFVISSAAGSQVCIAMELLGPSLLDLIRDTRYCGVPTATAKRIAKRVLAGLDFLHRKCTLIHTDVKPENILLHQEWSKAGEATGRGWWGERVGGEGGGGELGGEGEQNKMKWRLPAGWSAPFALSGEGAEREEGKRRSGDDDGCESGRREREGAEERAEGGAEGPQDDTPRHGAECANANANTAHASAYLLGAKLVDLGNACVVGKPFTDHIQTIEYRSPEVLVGAGYGTGADVWSLACTVFELLTGEYLFDCRIPEGAGRVPYSREESLLALQQELLGRLPAAMLRSGKLTQRYFTPDCKRLRNISTLQFWALPDVLRHKYGMPPCEAEEVASFLLPMLHLDPARRASARDMLAHPWLAGVE